MRATKAPRLEGQGAISVLCAAVLIAVLQLFDVGTTESLLRHAGGVEANPIAKFLLVAGWIVPVKTGLAAGFGWLRRGKVPSQALLITVWCVVAVYGTVVLGNLLDLAEVR